MAEGFTCEVNKAYRSACEGLAFYGEHEGKRYCVLHFPGKKNREVFEQVKKSKIVDRNDYNFGGIVFPEGTSNFEGVKFDAYANFSGATFIGEANFKKAQFTGGPTSFSGARFCGERTLFSGAEFSAEVDILLKCPLQR